MEIKLPVRVERGQIDQRFTVWDANGICWVILGDTEENRGPAEQIANALNSQTEHAARERRAGRLAAMRILLDEHREEMRAAQLKAMRVLMNFLAECISIRELREIRDKYTDDQLLALLDESESR